MTEQLNSLIGVLHRTLMKSNRMVKIPVRETEIVLGYFSAFDKIDDPDCEEIFETRASGVFKRFTVYSGDQSRYTWMRLCGLDKEELKASLDPYFDDMTENDLEAIKVSLLFQSVKRAEAEENAARRMSR